MNGIVNNPSKSIIIQNTDINQSVNIMNRIIGNIGYKTINVDNSMANAHVWTVTHNANIKGFIDTMIVGTYNFQPYGKGIKLTVEAGKGVGAISDQWELEDCNSYLQQALSIAVNPNITYKEEIEKAENANSAAAVIIGTIATIIFFVCML